MREGGRVGGREGGRKGGKNGGSEGRRVRGMEVERRVNGKYLPRGYSTSRSTKISFALGRSPDA